MVKNIQCGTIPFPVLTALQGYQDTFPFVKDEKTGNIKYVTVNDGLITAEQRTQAIDTVVKQFREKNMFVTLNGWRDEVFLQKFYFYQMHIFLIRNMSVRNMRLKLAKS